MKQTGSTVVIMCKAPVSGRVKTRLTASYSADQAAALHAAMATTVITRAARLFADVVIAADDVEHPFFARFGLPVSAQQGGDLGDRMDLQIEQTFAAGAASIMLLGTDSPHMLDSRLLQAAALLDDYDVVLGPVDDGGYDLVALRQPVAIFTGVIWSSATVLAQTLANIAQQGLTVAQLETSFDVDLPADVDRARQAGWQKGRDDG